MHMSPPPNRRCVRAKWAFAVTTAMVVAICAGGLGTAARRDQLVRDADALPCRLMEGRLSSAFAYRPFRRGEDVPRRSLFPLRTAESVLRQRWQVRHDKTSGRQAAEARLLAADAQGAIALMTELLERDSRRPDLLSAIHTSRDASLLSDFSAAMLQRPADPKALVLALEAADRAWQLQPTSTTA
jgi:hypothetical protein